MMQLYYYAEKMNFLVCGTTNKTEIIQGYFVKYGDGGVDILPLGNLVKGQVRELARFLDVQQSIIDKPPSAGLWAGQTDEGELGLSYEEIDRYLLTGQAASEVRAKIEARIAASAHKNQLPPVASL